MATSAKSTRSGPRILVADDSTPMRKGIRALLETQDDWRVDAEAADGAEAVAKFEKNRFDAVVLDFQMPNMDGLEAARRINALSPETPILMVTLHDTQALVQQARKAGVRGLCGKADIACLVEGMTAILANKPYFKL
jgi:DNA-binding NarL/FixJ family response regulator